MVGGKSKCEGKYFPNSGHFQPRGLPKFVVVYLLTPQWSPLASTCLPLSLCKPLASTTIHVARICTCFPQCQKNKLSLFIVLNLVSTSATTAPQFVCPAYWKGC